MVRRIAPPSNAMASHSQATSFSRHERPERPINLLRGWPSPTLLIPHEVAEQAWSTLHTKPPSKIDVSTDVETRTSASISARGRSLDYSDLAISEQALLYGPDEGHMPLRKALGKWLAEFYSLAMTERFSIDTTQEKTPEDRVTITGGASQSLGVVLGAVTDPTYTRNIWIIAPAYYLVFKIFEDAGFGTRLRAVPETASGPDLAFLCREMQNAEEKWRKGMASRGVDDIPQLKPSRRYPKIYKHIVYTVPTFSNPSSITTDLSTREQLVKIARDFDALVITDDVYDMLQWPARAASAPSGDSVATGSSLTYTSGVEEDFDFAHGNLPRLVDIDRHLAHPTILRPDLYGNTISNGSFSKICGPGVRCGWVECPTPDLAFLISQAGTQKSGGSPSQMTSTIMTGLVESGALTKHITNTLCPAYWKRWSTLVSAVERVLVPLGVRVARSSGKEADVAGGYFVWVTLPDVLGKSAGEIVERCLNEENMIVAGGKSFEVLGNEDDRLNYCLRLTLSWEAEPELVAGVERLGRVIERMINDAGDEKRGI